MKINELKSFYRQNKSEIEKRLEEFKMPSTSHALFRELAFTILTPQSRAKTCWNAILLCGEKLFTADASEIVNCLKGVRFAKTKAVRIVEARKKLPELQKKLKTEKRPHILREWLVENIKGHGMKEASHFLRNIGLGKNLAILDRHILKNLFNFGVLKEIPSSLPVKKYLEIEKKLLKFSRKIKIPPAHLDLLLWMKETGEIFK